MMNKKAAPATLYVGLPGALPTAQIRLRAGCSGGGAVQSMLNHVVLFFVFLLATVPAHADKVVELETRPAVTQKYLYLENRSAMANVILFAGGKGKLRFDVDWLLKRGKNFLVRTREMFRSHGFSVAVFDAPSDRRGQKGMKGGFRSTDQHVTDIAAVIGNLKKRNGLPVWLVGTSRGTESVAWAAIHIPEGIAGIVLTSSISEPNKQGLSLPEMELDRIRVPVFIVAHTGDECRVTPPAGARRIEARLKNAAKVEKASFHGGHSEMSNPCKAMTAHGFLGIEKDVVAAIAKFIKQTL